jgi:uncharacterized protein (TIGR02246 family)
MSQVATDAIRTAEANYDAAWNAGDLRSLLACFTEDAVLVNPRGEVAVGEGEICERLVSFLRGEARGSRHVSHVTRISFVTPEVAVVDGEALLEGGAGFIHMRHRFTDILVRRGDRWLLAHVRAYALEEEA